MAQRIPRLRRRGKEPNLGVRTCPGNGCAAARHAARLNRNWTAREGPPERVTACSGAASGPAWTMLQGRTDDARRIAGQGCPGAAAVRPRAGDHPAARDDRRRAPGDRQGTGRLGKTAVAQAVLAGSAIAVRMADCRRWRSRPWSRTRWPARFAFRTSCTCRCSTASPRRWATGPRLLFLDTCDHLATGCAPDRVAAACRVPNLRVLATSRIRAGPAVGERRDPPAAAPGCGRRAAVARAAPAGPARQRGPRSRLPRSRQPVHTRPREASWNCSAPASVTFRWGSSSPA